MSEDQAVASKNAITISANAAQYDILLPEPVFDVNAFLNNTSQMYDSTQNLTNFQDITIREDRSSALLNDDNDISAAFGIDLNIDQAQIDADWDLNLAGDDIEVARRHAPNESMEIEVGRDAPTEKPEFAPDLSMDMSMDKSRADAANNSMNMPDFSFEQDMGGGFGGGDDMMLDMPPLEADKENEATPQAKRTGGMSYLAFSFIILSDNTPREEVTPKAKTRTKKVAQASRKRKLAIDDEIELPAQFMAKQLEDTSDLCIKVLRVSFFLFETKSDRNRSFLHIPF